MASFGPVTLAWGPGRARIRAWGPLSVLFLFRGIGRKINGIDGSVSLEEKHLTFPQVILLDVTGFTSG